MPTKRRKTSLNTRYRKVRKELREAQLQLLIVKGENVHLRQQEQALGYFGRKLLRAANDDPTVARNYDVNVLLSFLKTKYTPEGTAP